jgi:hypothetical protein
MQSTVSPDLDALAERVARLEQRNRRLWAAVIGLAMLTAASLTAGARAAPDPLGVVEASGFLLKASETEVRAELRIDRDEGGKLFLYGSDGGQTLELPAHQQLLPLRAKRRATSD